jgi:hypothetical protein
MDGKETMILGLSHMGLIAGEVTWTNLAGEGVKEFSNAKRG